MSINTILIFESVISFMTFRTIELFPIRRGDTRMTLMPFSKSNFSRLVSFTLSVKFSPSTDIPYTNAFSISIPVVLGANINKKTKVHKFVDHNFVYQYNFWYLFPYMHGKSQVSRTKSAKYLPLITIF